MKDIISFCSWTLHSHVGLIHQDSPQTESSWARMPQTLTKLPAGATDGLRCKSSLNPWEERGWSESLHLSYQALWNAPRLLGNTMPNSPRKMDMDYTQVFQAWRISPKPSNDIWKSWKAPTCYFSLSGKAETVTPVEHRAPVSFRSLIWKPIREEFKVIASSHRHFAPKQLRWLSWEFILAVKSIVTDLVHENITKSYLISVLGWLVRQINQVGRQFWFSKPSLPGLRFEDPVAPPLWRTQNFLPTPFYNRRDIHQGNVAGVTPGQLLWSAASDLDDKCLCSERLAQRKRADTETALWFRDVDVTASQIQGMYRLHPCRCTERNRLYCHTVNLPPRTLREASALCLTHVSLTVPAETRRTPNLLMENSNSGFWLSSTLTFKSSVYDKKPEIR